ncbi:hypothetical protein HBB16_02530 [Pseudonocardia sp. MCCB 268]|nr:hypothetical protein [Pseudonocardia cytotoxica]
MYDTGRHTVAEIAETSGSGAAPSTGPCTLQDNGRACALIVYRNTRLKTDYTHRRYGENRRRREVPARSRPQMVPRSPRPAAPGCARWSTSPTASWSASAPSPASSAPGTTTHRGYADIPLGPPLTDLQIARQRLPPSISLGDPRLIVRGKIREYVTL